MKDPKAVTIWSKVDGIEDLAELALNLHWSWNHCSDELWRHLDAELWKTTRNPWVILQTVSKQKIEASLAEPDFKQRLDALLRKNRDSYKSDAWFQTQHPNSALTLTAYFSMEFMLSEALPIYSGGLGNVAGDQMKAASDLGVPVVGVGLLYGKGYFRQEFDSDGRQRALYPVNDPGQLPIRPLRRPNGEWVRLEIKFPGSKIWLRCWEVSVGRTKLYLLDTNDFANTPAQRSITGELYGGDPEMRLQQELVLGIGGWRLLRAIGLQPEVCHLNEGHAAFAVLERARCYMEDHKIPFDVALNVTRAGNLFTTHTAVAAGFDRFDAQLIRKYLTFYAEGELAIPVEALLAMGRKCANDTSEPFNMAYLAVHGSAQVNGVSKLHGQVSRKIFNPLFPRWPQHEVPVGSVTNGIHVPTWDSKGADALWTKACGPNRWLGNQPSEDDVRRICGADLWQMRCAGRKALISHVRERYALQLLAESGSTRYAGNVLDENTLTLGFARRFATYKRPNLLLRDPVRLIRLLTDPQRPVQLILAGKAHPQDQAGQDLIRQWNDFTKRPEVRSRVVFLSDDDMLLTQELVQGVDLWINTPRRPWEACGTSGMKVLVNGGLNLSELDGWWAEAYSPELGWAIGDGQEHGDDDAWDSTEAEELYALIEQEVVPQFYDRDPKQVPSRWLGRIRESMARLTSEFSASRAIREYTEIHYLPAAAGYLSRAANNSAQGISLCHWREHIAQNWNALSFSSVEVDTHDGIHFFRIQAYLGNLNTAELKVELYSNPAGGNTSAVETMSAYGPPDAQSLQTFLGEVPSSRPAADYTLRLVPFHPNASVPLEANQILWQR